MHDITDCFYELHNRILQQGDEAGFLDQFLRQLPGDLPCIPLDLEDAANKPVPTCRLVPSSIALFEMPWQFSTYEISITVAPLQRYHRPLKM